MKNDTQRLDWLLDLVFRKGTDGIDHIEGWGPEFPLSREHIDEAMDSEAHSARARLAKLQELEHKRFLIDQEIASLKGGAK